MNSLNSNNEKREQNLIPFKKTGIRFFIALIVVFILFWLYVNYSTYPAEEKYLAKIKANEKLSIEENRESNLFVITPQKKNPEYPSLVFYPGGLVEPSAYLYKMSHLAINLKTNVFIIQPPFNASIFAINSADKVFEHYESVNQEKLTEIWVGGHSLGGIAACRYAKNNPNKIHGVFLFGSYCDQNIKDHEFKIISIMGLEDNIIDWENYTNARQNLPPHAKIQEVEGLNHSDFGNYGIQDGDGKSQLNNQEIITLITKTFQSTF